MYYSDGRNNFYARNYKKNHFSKLCLVCTTRFPSKFIHICFVIYIHIILSSPRHYIYLYILYIYLYNTQTYIHMPHIISIVLLFLSDFQALGAHVNPYFCRLNLVLFTYVYTCTYLCIRFPTTVLWRACATKKHILYNNYILVFHELANKLISYQIIYMINI